MPVPTDCVGDRVIITFAAITASGTDRVWYGELDMCDDEDDDNIMYVVPYAHNCEALEYKDGKWLSVCGGVKTVEVIHAPTHTYRSIRDEIIAWGTDRSDLHMQKTSYELIGRRYSRETLLSGDDEHIPYNITGKGILTISACDEYGAAIAYMNWLDKMDMSGEPSDDEYVEIDHRELMWSQMDLSCRDEFGNIGDYFINVVFPQLCDHISAVTTPHAISFPDIVCGKNIKAAR